MCVGVHVHVYHMVTNGVHMHQEEFLFSMQYSNTCMVVLPSVQTPERLLHVCLSLSAPGIVSYCDISALLMNEATCSQCLADVQCTRLRASPGCEVTHTHSHKV